MQRLLLDIAMEDDIFKFESNKTGSKTTTKAEVLVLE